MKQKQRTASPKLAPVTAAAHVWPSVILLQHKKSGTTTHTSEGTMVVTCWPSPDWLSLGCMPRAQRFTTECRCLARDDPLFLLTGMILLSAGIRQTTQHTFKNTKAKTKRHRPWVCRRPRCEQALAGQQADQEEKKYHHGHEHQKITHALT